MTWTGGSVPTGEDSLFQFLAQPAKSGTYTFQVEQTYSDGSIVELVGLRVVGGAGADDRGEELARRRRLVAARRSSALVLAVVALVLAGAALLARGGGDGGGGKRPLA